MKRFCLLLAVLWMGVPQTARAGVPVARVVAGQVLAADSLRTHTLELIARGQLQEAIDYWVLSTGEEAPKWLLAAKVAFDASKQVAGACQGVARTVYSAFAQLGGRPEFVELQTQTKKGIWFINFQMPSGRNLMLSDNGYHLLVRMNGRAYDAYTGAAGMLWTDYLGRLSAASPVSALVVDAAKVMP